MTACPAHIRSFLARRMDTREKVEAVIALGEAPEGVLSIADLATSLRVPLDVMRSVAIQLRSAGWLELLRDGRARLLAPIPEERLALDDLVALYHRDRVTIATALAELGLDRVRVAMPDSTAALRVGKGRDE